MNLNTTSLPTNPAQRSVGETGVLVRPTVLLKTPLAPTIEEVKCLDELGGGEGGKARSNERVIHQFKDDTNFFLHSRRWSHYKLSLWYSPHRDDKASMVGFYVR